jgi:hypothetical protein
VVPDPSTASQDALFEKKKSTDPHAKGKIVVYHVQDVPEAETLP